MFKDVTARGLARGARRMPLLIAVAASLAAACAANAAGATPIDPQIAAGSNDVCAISQLGVLRCMGLNDAGQIGPSATAGTSNPTSTPQVVALGGPVAQVAIGYNHTCAVLVSGTVKCFGGNNLGQLGSSVNIGTSTPNPDPQTVPLAGPAASITASQFFSCALLRDGSVQCWGSNQYGMLGVALNAGGVTPTPAPQTVVLSGPATKISSGAFHVCALLQTGGTQCWGTNFYGELGTATNVGTFTLNLPLTNNLTGVSTDVSAATSFSCAVKQTAAVECFGKNQYGQLGNATGNGTGSPFPSPTAVSLGAPATQVATGGEFTCALLTGGGVSCMGDNNRGQLGSTLDNGSDVAHPTPTAVAGLSGPAVRIAASYEFVCVIINNGSVQCWGNNGTGQLGQDATATPMLSAPTTVPGLSLYDMPPKVNFAVAKPKLKAKRKGRRLSVSSTVNVTAASGTMTADSCSGAFSATLSGKVKNKRTHKTRVKRYAKRTANLAFSGGLCKFELRFKLARALAGKKLSLALAFAGGDAANAFSQTFNEKIPRAR